MARPRLSALEALLIVIVAIPLLGTFFPFESYLSAPTLANPLGNPVPSSGLTPLVLGVLAIIIGALFAASPVASAQGLWRAWPLLAFVGWMFVTALWAEQPSFSFNRSGRTLLCCLYGIYIARHFDSRSMVRILAYSLLAGLLASLLVTLAAPGLSRVVDFRGAWRGAYSHKNSMGAIATAGTLFGIFSWGLRAVPRWVSIVLVLLAVTFVLISNSITALVALCVAVTVVTYLKLAASGPPDTRVVALIVATLGVMCLAGLYWLIGDQLSIGGRDATLTGRTAVWQYVNVMIDLKPILGWGHGGWGSPAFQEKTLLYLMWPAPHAHNTWLDARLQLGIPGLLFAVLMSGIAVWRAARLVLLGQNSEYLVWVAVLIYLGLRSYSETIWLDPAQSDMLWFTLAFMRLTELNDSLRARLHRPSPARFGRRESTARLSESS